jgi:hypothetical protein
LLPRTVSTRMRPRSQTERPSSATIQKDSTNWSAGCGWTGSKSKVTQSSCRSERRFKTITKRTTMSTLRTLISSRSTKTRKSWWSCPSTGVKTRTCSLRAQILSTMKRKAKSQDPEYPPSSSTMLWQTPQPRTEAINNRPLRTAQTLRNQSSQVLDRKTKS